MVGWRTASVSGMSMSTKTSCINTRDDACMNPRDLSGHLRPLMERIAEDISTWECEELAAAIYEYRDVFNSGLEDMGQTYLVTHSIDTREHHPIRLPPRRLPITKQDVEKTEVQKMLDRGVIEPCQSRWAGPLVLVTKKDGSTRFCVDYPKVNEVTCKDAYLLRWIDNNLDTLQGSKYF